MFEDIYAFLVSHSNWTLRLIKRNYPFTIEYINTYLYEHHYWANERSNLEDFICNPNVLWERNFLVNYSSSIKWEDVKVFNKDLYERAVLTGVDIPDIINEPKAIPFSEVLLKYSQDSALDMIQHLAREDQNNKSKQLSSDAEKEILNEQAISILLLYQQTWTELQSYMTKEFVDFMMAWEYQTANQSYQYEEKYRVAEQEYNRQEYERMKGEDPDDYTINNSDFDDETIEDAFEGDEDNTWNVD